MNASDEFADGEVARRIGDWELAETLGRGGAGVVYAATNVRTGVAGALKLARDHHLLSPEETRLAPD